MALHKSERQKFEMHHLSELAESNMFKMKKFKDEVARMIIEEEEARRLAGEHLAKLSESAAAIVKQLQELLRQDELTSKAEMRKSNAQWLQEGHLTPEHFQEECLAQEKRKAGEWEAELDNHRQKTELAIPKRLSAGLFVDKLRAVPKRKPLPSQLAQDGLPTPPRTVSTARVGSQENLKVPGSTFSMSNGLARDKNCQACLPIFRCQVAG